MIDADCVGGKRLWVCDSVGCSHVRGNEVSMVSALSTSRSARMLSELREVGGHVVDRRGLDRGRRTSFSLEGAGKALLHLSRVNA